MSARVSVVMTTFNGERYVKSAIDSVLQQQGVAIEMLVVDDGSTDGTLAAVERLAGRDSRVRVDARAHAGIAAARNAGVARARGTHVAFLDQDDLCPPGKLARQLALLEGSPGAAAVFGETEIFDGRGHRARTYTMVLAAGLFRRDAVESVGEFDAGYASADDLDFLLRLIESGARVELEPGLGTCHRRHAGQATADLEATRRECVRALAASLRRRRRSGARGPLTHPLIAASTRGVA
jgi:glycosyltransferase involved in cell wall biosynthesis